MSLFTKYGSFAVNTVTGDQAITGLGFQPKLVIFFGNDCVSDGSRASADFTIGMVDSGGRCGSINAESVDGGVLSVCHRVCRDNRPYGVYSASSTACVLTAKTLDADGFTVTVSTADASNSRIINYLAIGGTDVTDVYVGKLTTPVSTGNFSVTGLSFQPDAVLMFTAGIAASAAAGSPVSMTTDIGAMVYRDGSMQQFTSAGRSRNGVNISDTTSYQRNDRVIASINPSSDLTLIEASAVSMNADGFTLNFSAVDTGGRDVIYVALKGGNYGVGSFTGRTGSAGSQAITGLGFTPKGLLLSSMNLPATTGLTSAHRRTLGAATGASERGSVWYGDGDTLTTMTSDSVLDRTKVFVDYSEGTPTLNAAADLSSLDYDGFTLNWSTADSTDREIFFFAFGDTDVATTTTTTVTTTTTTSTTSTTTTGTTTSTTTGTTTTTTSHSTTTSTTSSTTSTSTSTSTTTAPASQPPGEETMNYGDISLNDNLDCFPTFMGPSGAADPSTATYAVYEDDSASAILTGSLLVPDQKFANVTGLYHLRLAITAANGFRSGHVYTIIYTYVISGRTYLKREIFSCEKSASLDDVKARVSEVLWTDSAPELQGPPAADAPIGEKMNWVFVLNHHPKAGTRGTTKEFLVYNSTGSQVIGRATMTDDGIITMRGRIT